MSFDENEGLCPPFLNPIPDYQNLLSRLELLPADDNDRPLPASPKSYVSSDATDPDPDIVLRPRPRTTDWTGADEAIERFTQYFKQFNENFRRVTQLVDKMKPPPENHFRRQPIASPPRVSSPQQASPRPGRIPADEDDYVPLFTVRQVPPEATGRIVEPVGRKRVKWEGHEETMAARKPAFEQSAEKLKRVAQFTNQLCPPNYTFQTQHQVPNIRGPPFKSVAESWEKRSLIQHPQGQGPAEQSADPAEPATRPLRRSPRIAKIEQRREVAGSTHPSATPKPSPGVVERSRDRPAKAGMANQRGQKNADPVQLPRTVRRSPRSAKQSNGRPVRATQIAREAPSTPTTKEPTSRPNKRHKER